jgi:hypothetical protein
MTVRLIPYLFTCGPFLLALAAWTKLCRAPRWPKPIALGALCVVTANAILAAGVFLYYDFKPSPLPPWQNPQTLTLSLLFLLAPIGMIVGLVAAFQGAPKWLICVVEIASVPLLLVGVMAGNAV